MGLAVGLFTGLNDGLLLVGDGGPVGISRDGGLVGCFVVGPVVGFFETL